MLEERRPLVDSLQAPVRVMLVDDHPGFLAAMKALLATDTRVSVVGATDNAAHALEVATAATPEVALVDLAMPGLDGFVTTRLLRDAVPGLRVMVVSGVADDGAEARAVAAGACTFLVKGRLGPEVADAILAAAGRIGPHQ